MRAAALREGGHGVDFRGAQMGLLERMDLVDEVRRHETGLGDRRAGRGRRRTRRGLPPLPRRDPQSGHRRQNQAKGAGPFLAPLTEAKIRRRNRIYRALSSRPLSWVFARLTAGAANAVSLEGYATTTTGLTR